MPFYCEGIISTSPTSQYIVSLNVGGHLFTTTKSTLTKFSSVGLDKIMRNCDKEGKVFVDRDGRMFQDILGFLRTGQLCLPDDFSEFDYLTTEVEAYEICILSKRLEDMRLEKMLVKSIEILETTVDEYINTVLKGKKEDLATLPLAAHKRYRPELEDKDSSFLKLILLDNARLGMAEVLRRKGGLANRLTFHPHLIVLQMIRIV